MRERISAQAPEKLAGVRERSQSKSTQKGRRVSAQDGQRGGYAIASGTRNARIRP